MRAFIILATIALAHGAKLERTYLPPSHARTSGGSGNFLQTPVSGPSSQSQSNGFAQTGAGFSQSGNGFPQAGNGFSQAGNGFSQTGAEFFRSGNGFSQNGLEIPSERNNGFNNFGGESRPERAQAALERNAAILRQDNSNDGETFSYAFETENGIYAEESGVATNGVEAQGGYSYTGDDGQVYSIRYTADQNGFVAQGDHIPTAPPVPEEILKALEQNARDEAAGIFDDGTYNEAKYSDSNAYNGQQNYQQNYQQYNNDDDTVVTNAAFARNSDTSSRGSSSATRGSTGSVNGVEKAYLPPFAAQASASIRGPTSGIGGPTSAIGGPTSAIGGRTSANFARGRASSGVEKTYLPPLTAQAGNGFGKRQQAFDSKNGYRY